MSNLWNFRFEMYVIIFVMGNFGLCYCFSAWNRPYQSNHVNVFWRVLKGSLYTRVLSLWLVSCLLLSRNTFQLFVQIVRSHSLKYLVHRRYCISPSYSLSLTHHPIFHVPSSSFSLSSHISLLLLSLSHVHLSSIFHISLSLSLSLSLSHSYLLL